MSTHPNGHILAPRKTSSNLEVQVVQEDGDGVEVEQEQHEGQDQQENSPAQTLYCNPQAIRRRRKRKGQPHWRMSSLVHAFRSLSVLEIPRMSQVMAMLHLGSMFPNS